MKIALDAMGGDSAPMYIVEGAVEASREMPPDAGIALVGKQSVLDEYISKNGLELGGIEIVDAPEVIGMSESPTTGIRRKRNSSIMTAMRLHKEGEVQAVVSAGNTGAIVASSLLSLGRLSGIKRPAITLTLPSENKDTVFLDVGANSDCDPGNMYQFALMGSLYAETFLGRENPKIGLLSIGEESSKGNELTRESNNLFASSNLNFVGNVEGHDIFFGAVDVVVTDGFVGNVVLKFTESIVAYINSLLRNEISKHPTAKLGAAFMKSAFRGLRRKLDYAEYGGLPLLGVNGVVIIGHGGSSPMAIKNAILSAAKFVNSDINDKIMSRAKEA